MSAVYIILFLATQVGLSWQQNRFPLPPTGCICPGSNLTFECSIEGEGITVWNGNFFTKSVGIPLVHNQFNTFNYYGICNNGAVVARPHNLRPVENGMYTSQLDINMTMISLKNGSMVTCAHDHLNRTVTIVGTWTMIDPPANLRLEQKNETHLKFSWDSVLSNCPLLTYNIFTKNCGVCLDSVNSTTVYCEILDLEMADVQVCSIAVQRRCGGAVNSLIGNLSDILQVILKDESDGELISISNGYKVAIGILSLLSLIGLLAIAKVIKDFHWITQHSIKFYVSDEPNSLPKALQVFKDHDVNITIVHTYPKTIIKDSIICKGFHISYECPKIKVKRLIKDLFKAKAEVVKLENKANDDDLESGSTVHPANRTILSFSVKDERGTLAEAMEVLGPAKCCSMIISRKKSRAIPPPIIFVGNCPLNKVSTVKYLGVQINSDLSWSTHITNLCNKARRLIGLLYRRFYSNADTKTMLQLYKTFIRPHLEYCSSVWDPYLIKDVEALEKVQRFGLRVCLKKWDLDQEQLLHAAGVVSLSDRRAHAKLSHLFKLVNQLIDYPDAPLYRKVHHYNARQSNTKQLIIPRARTLQFQRSFFPDTIKRWNSLPPDSISCTSLPIFKNSLCGHN